MTSAGLPLIDTSWHDLHQLQRRPPSPPPSGASQDPVGRGGRQPGKGRGRILPRDERFVKSLQSAYHLIRPNQCRMQVNEASSTRKRGEVTGSGGRRGRHASYARGSGARGLGSLSTGPAVQPGSPEGCMGRRKPSTGNWRCQL